MKKIGLLSLAFFITLTQACQNPFLDRRDLFTAIQSNKPEEVIAYTSLIERKQGSAGLKEALSITNEDGLSVLGYAVSKTNPTIVNHLLKKGAPTDFRREKDNASLLNILIKKAITTKK